MKQFSSIAFAGVVATAVVLAAPAPLAAPPAVATLEFSGERPVAKRQIVSGKVRVSVVPGRRIKDSPSEQEFTIAASVDGRRVFTKKVQTSYDSLLIQVAEMDRSNPYPEVVYSNYSGGAHCCTSVVVVTSSSDGRSWSEVEAGEYDGEPRPLEDPDREGVYKVVQSDRQFLYLYSSYAESFPPLLVTQLVKGKLEDVSSQKRFWPLHRKRLKEMSKVLKEQGPGSSGINGTLAGFVATKAILGETADGWRTMLGSYDRTSDWGLEECQGGTDNQGKCKGKLIKRTFPEALRLFLVDAGYVRPEELPQD